MWRVLFTAGYALAKETEMNKYRKALRIVTECRTALDGDFYTKRLFLRKISRIEQRLLLVHTRHGYWAEGTARLAQENLKSCDRRRAVGIEMYDIHLTLYTNPLCDHVLAVEGAVAKVWVPYDRSTHTVPFPEHMRLSLFGSIFSQEDRNGFSKIGLRIH